MTLSALDPRTPFVFELGELERRPGSSRRVTVSLPAPAGMGLGGVIEVPEGAAVELDLRLESVMEGVLVSGVARAPFTAECVRCLESIDGVSAADVQELYAYPERVEGLGPDRDDESRVEDGMIDLEQPVRDAVVLALPQAPVCRPDCPGLCSVCGVRLADEPGHAHDTTDPRWAALAGLLADENAPSGSSRAGLTEES